MIVLVPRIIKTPGVWDQGTNVYEATVSVFEENEDLRKAWGGGIYPLEILPRIARIPFAQMETLAFCDVFNEKRKHISPIRGGLRTIWAVTARCVLEPLRYAAAGAFPGQGRQMGTWFDGRLGRLLETFGFTLAEEDNAMNVERRGAKTNESEAREGGKREGGREV
jgi:hypothetical protein